MRNLTTAILTVALQFSAFAQHQHTTHSCGSDLYFEQQAQLHPELALQRQIELDNYVDDETSYASTESVVHTIPVVFHVMYYNFEDSISIAQIEDGLAVVNEDYSLTNADAGNVRAQFASIQANMEFHFELAKIDPQGNATNGVTYHQSDRSLGANDAIKSEYYWNNNKYLNIWVVRAIDLGLPPSQGTILGYAAFPAVNQSATNDGIVIRHDQLGRIGTATSIGRTLTHEMGHWLNLLHPFNYGCNNNGDLVGDTPPVASASFGCDLSKVSCGVTTMIENYMDYADDVCTNSFTNGQKSRAKACVNNTVYNRFTIASQANLIATGVANMTVNAAPTADFKLDQHQFCTGQSVDFINLTQSHINTTYSWVFTSPAGTKTSTLENPSMTFNAPGMYTVALTATNASGTSTKSKAQYFKVVDNASPIYNNNFTATFDNTVPNVTWMVFDDGDGRTWETTSAASFAGGKSVVMPTFNALAGGMDILESTPILLDQTSTAVLSFKYAWARKDNGNQDRLTISVSKDCGATWQIARMISSFNLSTVGTSPITTNFVPTSSQWAEATVNLTNYIGPDPLRIRLSYKSDSGNNLYIDELRTAVTVGSEELASGFTRIYPNPTKDMLTIEMTGEKTKNYTLSNLNGQAVLFGSFSTNTETISVASLPKGVYFLQITSEGKTVNEKVIVE